MSNDIFDRIEPALRQYVEGQIVPRYTCFDGAHNVGHVRQVIRQSLELAEGRDLDPNMVYAIAAFHDTGLCEGRERHHIVSGEILMQDAFLRSMFAEEQLQTMREAVEDHRASSATPPRSLYGRIVAEADRCIDVDTVVRRTIRYGLTHSPELDREGHYTRCREHIVEKYGESGYIRFWIDGSANERRLEELRTLVADEGRFRNVFWYIFEQEIDM